MISLISHVKFELTVLIVYFMGCIVGYIVGRRR